MLRHCVALAASLLLAPGSALGSSESVVYSFQGGPDGQLLNGGLAAIKGVLFGVTFEGGLSAGYGSGSGTAFSLTPGVAKTILHTFGTQTPDAVNPNGLIKSKGRLYGTSVSGGTYVCETNVTCGTAFELTEGGSVRLLHQFAGGVDGQGPTSNLLAVNGTLYGVTPRGGKTGCGSFTCGTIFSITAKGVYKQLYEFGAGSDGNLPEGELVNVAGTLFGTTAAGGAFGKGTIFSLTPDGHETVIYSFKGGTDGYAPYGGLLYLNGAFYGTTVVGGGSTACLNGCGTVFIATPAGNETVLYQFKGGTDGANPLAGLTRHGSELFGTTSNGGTAAIGTVYKIDLSGNEKLIHSFQGGADGAQPKSALIEMGGSLYGTTAAGGDTIDCPNGFPSGCGTVFKILP